MNIKRIASTVSIFFAFFSCIYGYSITLVVAQEDTTQPELRPTTRVIEDLLLNSFFDNGDIVSNEPIIIDSQDTAAMGNGLRFAAAGGFDYVLQLTVQYKNQVSSNSMGVLPADIQGFRWELFRSPEIRKIANGTFVPPANLTNVTGKNEITAAIKKMCDEVQKDINTAIAEVGRSR